MSQKSNTPTTITAEQMQKFVDHLYATLSCKNSNDEIDFDLLQRNIAAQLGHWVINYNGILMRERMKLAEIQEKLALVNAKAYAELKQQTKFETDQKGMAILVEGHEEYRMVKLEFSKQEAYVKFVESVVAHLQFYPKNAGVLLQTVEVREKYGY